MAPLLILAVGAPECVLELYLRKDHLSKVILSDL
jgi:hypothetical protein